MDQRRPCLKIAQLCKSFGTAFEPAAVWFCPLVHDPVGLNIASLSKPPATAIAGIGSLASMTTFMSLYHISTC